MEINYLSWTLLFQRQLPWFCFRFSDNANGSTEMNVNPTVQFETVGIDTPISVHRSPLAILDTLTGMLSHFTGYHAQ